MHILRRDQMPRERMNWAAGMMVSSGHVRSVVQDRLSGNGQRNQRGQVYGKGYPLAAYRISGV
jgi:hypothetical protein